LGVARNVQTVAIRTLEQQIRDRRIQIISTGAGRAGALMSAVGVANYFASNAAGVSTYLNLAFLALYIALVLVRSIALRFPAGSDQFPSAAQRRTYGCATLSLGITWGLWLAISTKMPLENQVYVFSLLIATMFVAIGTLAANQRWYFYLVIPALVGMGVMLMLSDGFSPAVMVGLSFGLLGCSGFMLISHSKALDTAIRDSIRHAAIEHQHDLMFESGRGTIAVTTRNQLVRITPATAQLLGIPANAVLLDLRHGLKLNPAHWGRLMDRVIKHLNNFGLLSTSLEFTRPDGKPIWLEVQARLLDPFNADRGIFWQFTDATVRRELEEKNNFLATHDSLTGIWNRVAVDAKLRELCDQVVGERTTQGFCLLSLDLDGFKQVNDQNGHATGDAVLKIVAQRLTRSLRPTDWVARVGGDEFIVLLPCTSLPEQAAQVSEKLIETVSKPIHVNDKKLEVGVSVGLAIWPNDSVSADALLRIADVNMYTSKQAGRNAYRRALTGFV
jgi:diguanylate cyclase (GGDEF)-like protein